jgi:hypothetical protein
MKIMTLKEYDAIKAARGEAVGERLPFAKDADLVHACPGKAGPIRVVLGAPLRQTCTPQRSLSCKPSSAVSRATPKYAAACVNGPRTACASVRLKRLSE